jgi:hypothetical protein
MSWWGRSKEVAMNMMYEEVKKVDQLELELMVDRHGVKEVLWMLARVCADKADRLKVDWQYEGSAKQWERRMDKIESVASKLDQ